MAKKILIVEDDEKLIASLADNLRVEGYKVFTALDGESGWELARKNTYDLIVLDIMLPGLDGLSLCRRIRNDSKIPDMPIIILTARGTEGDKVHGLDYGADDYIVKPFGLHEFLARVRVQMRRPLPDQNARRELISGGLRLDLTGRRVFKGSQEVKLSNKEFDLLAELMRNKNAVLSRDLILTKVWGYDYFGDKRTVDVHIRWLREKIEDNPSSPNASAPSAASAIALRIEHGICLLACRRRRLMPSLLQQPTQAGPAQPRCRHPQTALTVKRRRTRKSRKQSRVHCDFQGRL